MKRGIGLVAILGGLVLAAPAISAAPAIPEVTHVVPADLVGSVFTGIQEQPKLDVDVNVNKDNDGWAVSPVWLAIGAIGLVVLIMLIAMAFRGRETTVVRQ
jgi:hypothetical protein